MEDSFIVDAVRTPRARRKGKFSSVHPIDLLTYPLNAIVQRNNIKPESIEDVAIGCVTQTGEQGWCVARGAILAAGWPISVPGTTINRLCASSQQAVGFISSSIKSGQYELAIAGGLEHMTRAPMFSDIGGEESPLLKKHHPNLVQQGMAAELLAKKYEIARSECDLFALKSQQRAKVAIEGGFFKKSIIPVPYTDQDRSSQIMEIDDNPRFDTNLEALSTLKTPFSEEGVITAGNASGIVDGASAILLASKSALAEFNLKPRAKVVTHATVGSDPLIMLDGPVAASRAILKRAGLGIEDIDLWEINEAFAPVPILAIRALGIDPEKVNVCGGAIALGHPLGATGAILIGSALDELERRAAKRALITMCIGLGMACATIIERI
ncbi:MAG TPA: thiolase family protein [Oligoflexia bacterium]|nr:thiolase family protein [Oligoflexia bacterium]HMP27789.1 thiolase family protein [Oligoflexia bacterium]